MRAGYNSKLRH